VRRALLLITAGCGRIWFDPLGQASDGSNGGDGGSGDAPPACSAFGPWQTQSLINELDTPIDEDDPAVRFDELEIVFAHEMSAGAPNDLFAARRSSTIEPFGPTYPLTALNSAGKDDGPAFSSDGLTLYWTSDAGGIRLWRATRTDTAQEFSNPELVPGGPFNEHAAPSISRDGLELFDSTSSGDLYVATRPTVNDPFGVPVLMPAPVASAQWQEGPSIAADDRTLYWGEDNTSSLFELRMATRADRTSPFSAPTVLADISMGEAWDAEISADGRTLYFSRYTAGQQDIWVTHRDCQ
jgi:hypothetical protein